MTSSEETHHLVEEPRALTEAEERWFAAVEWRARHVQEHPCLPSGPGGVLQDGSGCEEERQAWRTIQQYQSGAR